MEADEDRYRPMELGTVQRADPATPGPAAADDGDSGDGQPTQWPRWVALGAALLAGAAVGIVANNARNDAAEYGQVDLVRGTVLVETAPPLATGPQTMTVNLINTGPREIEILGVRIDGFVPAEDADPGADGDAEDDPEDEPIIAAPGLWVAARTTVHADCDRRPPGTVEVRVRTGSGEQTVVVEGQPGDDQLIWAWQYGCDSSPESGVFIGDTRTVSADSSGARIVLPVSNGTGQAIQILELEATTPGFTMTTDTMPVDVAAGELVDVLTTWTVTDCADAARFTDATVAVNVGSGDMESRITQPLGNPTLIELVRLAVRVCET
ncbi:hypothetical protein [Jiangella asiatica]|uniref:Uncharacterized protein n=1 Tax=Jiangella asiatica TaxID=2530372 RepID=A0A4R5CP25_9ACTN|nr:hypothetical protein [Jiangella asiatica]TDE00511.1 hypothetical protein E1269_25440 [Jiangella asiatica]